MSNNDVTFSAMERGAALFGKATFAMDRGYDDNKMFLELDEPEQDYVIRLTAKRKLFFHGKWVPATQLRNQRKGKIKTALIYKGKKHDAYLSHVKVQITASKKDIYLVLVYGITEHPMMLATNKKNQIQRRCGKYRPDLLFQMAHMSMKPETHALKVAIIKKADPIKEKVQFSYYRLAKGISGILSYAKEGIMLWFRTKRPAYRQLCLKLVV